jgi:hypothetical protein
LSDKGDDSGVKATVSGPMSSSRCRVPLELQIAGAGALGAEGVVGVDQLARAE